MIPLEPRAGLGHRDQFPQGEGAGVNADNARCRPNERLNVIGLDPSTVFLYVGPAPVISTFTPRDATKKPSSLVNASNARVQASP